MTCVATGSWGGPIVGAHGRLSRRFAWFHLVAILACLVLAGPVLAVQLTLSWNDASYNEDGFSIERRLGSDSIYAVIDTVGPNVTTYPDTTVTVGVSYCYRV